jgi:hypothetical protein
MGVLQKRRRRSRSIQRPAAEAEFPPVAIRGLEVQEGTKLLQGQRRLTRILQSGTERNLKNKGGISGEKERGKKGVLVGTPEKHRKAIASEQEVSIRLQLLHGSYGKTFLELVKQHAKT